MIEIRRARPDESEALTALVHAAKRHWDYPQEWIDSWKSDLTLTPEFIANNEVFVQPLLTPSPAAVHSSLANVSPSWSTCGSIPSRWAKESDGLFSSTPRGAPPIWDSANLNYPPIRMPK